MQRAQQFIFVVSVGALSWLAMMAVHELGHIVGAYVTGGSVERVVLHPLSISRTDVDPNPHPGVVVWLGPGLGCLIPLAVFASMPRCCTVLNKVAGFLAGFCLIANGAYISIGAFDGVGDCGEMLRTGTPLWVLLVFGAVTIPWGLGLWHRLGSLKQFINDPSSVTPRMAYVTSGVLVALIVAELAFSQG